MGVRVKLRSDEARLFFEQEHLDDALFAVGSGELALHSSRSPAKDTPNEDAAGIVAAGPDSAVVAVADGVGGAPAGRQASSIAIKCIATATHAAIRTGLELRYGILSGFEAANEEILALGVGAATTLAVVEIAGSTVRPFHVGDSFMLITGQRGKIKSQTIPHSPTGYAIESGLLEEKDAMHHEDRHVISNVIGSAEMRIDVGSPVELAPHDTLVLASDGLSDNLLTPEIVALVRKGPVATAAAVMSRLAQQRMELADADTPSKPDDLTFLIFRLR
jgi:serine/threonine protein phosphatase PrpC